VTRILFEQLENAGFLRGTDVSPMAVAEASLKQLLDVASEAAELTSVAELPRETSIFAQSASKALGAGRHPCSSLVCRTRRADELGRFAALYADRVYIHNFLTDPLAAEKHGVELQEDVVKQEFYNDLSVLAHLRPIIEAGKVNIVTPVGVSCAQCLAEQAWGPEAGERLGKQFDELKEQLLRETQISIRFERGEFRIAISGPDRLIEHGRAFRLKEPPDALRARPRLLKQVLAGNRLSLSRSAREDLDLHSRLTYEVVGDMAFELAVTQALNTTFLVDRELYVDILGSLSGRSETAQRNQLIASHLTSLVPFAEDLDLVTLLRIREGEGAAFEQFRAGLNAAVMEMQRRSGRFTDAEARQVYSDIIAPGPANLDQKVSNARAALRLKALRKGAAWVGAISFGVYTGFLPAELIGAAKTLGLAKVVADLSEAILAQSDSEKSVKGEQLYFLWRARQSQAGARGAA
jgi:hypothetical protein